MQSKISNGTHVDGQVTNSQNNTLYHANGMEPPREEKVYYVILRQCKKEKRFM